MEYLRRRPIYICIFTMFMLALMPFEWWYHVPATLSKLHNLNVVEIFKSTTLYHVIFQVQKPSLLGAHLMYEVDEKTVITHTDHAYHRILRDVIRRKKVGKINHESSPLFGSVIKPDVSEKAEAAQCLRAAISYKSSGHLSKAKKLLEHALTLDPDNIDVLITLGETLEDISMRERASNQQSLSHSLVSIDSNSKSHGQSDSLILVAEHLYTKALVINPTLQQACFNRERLMAIVEEIDQRLFNTIDYKVHQFYHIPESNPGLIQAKMEHYFKHIYHSNAIEGNTLSLAQTRSILETRLAVGGKSIFEHNEVLGLDAALRYLNRTLLHGQNTLITLDNILELHRRLLGFVDLEEAGHLRRTQVYVADHHPPAATDLQGLMSELLAWINSNVVSDVHPIELAALVHWKFVFIHPFYDGNGRTARLLMNLILMRAGLPPAIIKIEDRPTYYELIKIANDGDVRPFIRFIAGCTERTIDEYLEASVPTRMEVREVTVSEQQAIEDIQNKLPTPVNTLHSLSSCDRERPNSDAVSVKYHYLLGPPDQENVIPSPNVIYLGG